MLGVGPHVARGLAWANGVLEGSVPGACPLAKRAVIRFQKDLARSTRKRSPWKYEFDAAEAERWLDFLADLRHVKGRWAGKPFEPSGYQCFATANLYGWRLREDEIDPETGEVTPAGTRRFLEALILVPRKNGKSFWFAGLGLAHLCIDGEEGAEVYCGATSEKQAWEVFRPARLMAARDEALRDLYGIEVNAKSLWRMEDGSRFEPVIGNPGDGPSPSCSITDEYHEHKTRTQVDTMETGMGARAQPMALKISTAGSDFGGPCYDEYREGKAILEGATEDETKFVLIFEADPKVAWESDEAIRQANPNLGVSVSRRYLDVRRRKALGSPSLQAAYKTKHLDHWVGARVAAFNMLRLQRCALKTLRVEDYAGERAFGGIDLASRTDVASFGVVIPLDKLLASFCWHWVPEAAVYGDDVKNPNYRAWAEAGQLIVTPGDTIDFDFIEEQVKQIATLLQLVELGYDPYQATQFATHLASEGIEVVELRPTPLNYSEPMREIDQQILNRTFAYNGDPVLTWMFGNVVARMRGMKGDLIMPDKEREEQKIDGVVALINAVNRWIAHKSKEIPSGWTLSTA